METEMQIRVGPCSWEASAEDTTLNIATSPACNNCKEIQEDESLEGIMMILLHLDCITNVIRMRLHQTWRRGYHHSALSDVGTSLQPRTNPPKIPCEEPMRRTERFQFQNWNVVAVTFNGEKKGLQWIQNGLLSYPWGEMSTSQNSLNSPLWAREEPQSIYSQILNYRAITDMERGEETSSWRRGQHTHW